MIWERMIQHSIPQDVYSYNAHIASRGAQHDAEGVVGLVEVMLGGQGRGGHMVTDTAGVAGVAGAPEITAHTAGTAGVHSNRSEAGVRSNNDNGITNRITSSNNDNGIITTTSTQQHDNTQQHNSTLSVPSNPTPSPPTTTTPAPDSYTFTVAFKSAAGAPNHYPSAWLLTTYRAMLAAGIQPNTKIVSALLTAAATRTWKMTTGEAEGVLALVPGWRGAGLLDDVAYGQLLLLCGRQGLGERLADVWLALLEVGGGVGGGEGGRVWCARVLYCESNIYVHKCVHILMCVVCRMSYKSAYAHFQTTQHTQIRPPQCTQIHPHSYTHRMVCGVPLVYTARSLPHAHQHATPWCCKNWSTKCLTTCSSQWC